MLTMNQATKNDIAQVKKSALTKTMQAQGWDLYIDPGGFGYTKTLKNGDSALVSVDRSADKNGDWDFPRSMDGEEVSVQWTDKNGDYLKHKSFPSLTSMLKVVK